MTVSSTVPPQRSLPPHRRIAACQQLQALVAGSPRRRWRRWTFVATSGALIALGSGASAVAYVLSQPVANKSEARCYTVASLAGGRAFRGTTVAAAGQPGTTAQVNNALSICATLWRQGFLHPGAPGISRPTDPHATNPVPPLVTCVISDGTAAVFPGDPGTCRRLGLPNATHP